MLFLLTGEMAARLRERLAEKRQEVSELEAKLGDGEQTPLTEEHRRQLREQKVGERAVCLSADRGMSLNWAPPPLPRTVAEKH